MWARTTTTSSPHSAKVNIWLARPFALIHSRLWSNQLKSKHHQSIYKQRKCFNEFYLLFFITHKVAFCIPIALWSDQPSIKLLRLNYELHRKNANATTKSTCCFHGALWGYLTMDAGTEMPYWQSGGSHTKRRKTSSTVTMFSRACIMNAMMSQKMKNQCMWHV
jgi:hypothetical protein